MADIIKALREATDSAGGYLVPDEFAARVLDLIQAKSITLPDLEVVSMGSDVMHIPKATGASTAYWVAETGTITASETAYGRITLTAKKVASLIEASTEVLEDNNVSLANHLTEQMARDLALKIDDGVLNGTGATASPFEGLRYTGSFTNAVWADGTVGTTGTGSATISLTPVSKAVDQVIQDNHPSPDISYWAPRTVGSLRLLTDGNARPMFNNETWGSPLLKEGVLGTIYGMKVKSSTQLPINLSYGTGSGETSNADAIVGVSKQFGLLGNRRQLRFRRDYKIATDIEQFQATQRLAFAVKYPNAYCVIRGITD
jgi:HK97 family phage major capsid protein